MLQSKRFVICGVNRLTIRVARALTGQNSEVTILRTSGEGDALLRLLPPTAHRIDISTEDILTALQDIGLTSVTCLLALADDDLTNLRIAVAAREAAAHVPVVLRAFDPGLADQLEQGLNIRRAYSMSALAAPAFIAAACGDAVLETLRLGNDEVPVCRLTVRPDSLLAGKTPSQIKARFGCGLLARCLNDDVWVPICGDDSDAPLSEGASVLIGGPLSHVLRLLCLNVGWLRERKRRRNSLSQPASRSHPARRPTFLPYVAAVLLAVLVLSVAVFGQALHLSLVDAVYFVITTANGNLSLQDSPDWLKLYGCVVMLTGGALLGVLFSYLAALATAERLEETMGRRAGRMRDHVVLAGLGNLGYRIARLLTDLGLSVAVLELTPDSRFSEAVRPRAPVLTGDARLPENLERVSVRQAVAFLGCTNDDLANIQACLHVRRLNPETTTVARIFDDTLADRLTDAFTIDRALSASQCAVSAFLGAATDERALRPLHVGELALIACRYTVEISLSPETIADWRRQGVRILAFRTPTGTVQPASELPSALADGDELILCGPAPAIQAITLKGSGASLS